MYLLDTNVVSELRKGRKANPSVICWQESVRQIDCLISVVTEMEIVEGIAGLRGKDLEFARILERWFAEVVRVQFQGLVCPVNSDIALLAGEILAVRTRDTEDALIAATALQLDLILVSRNTKDFEDTGVKLMNPWEFGERAV